MRNNPGEAFASMILALRAGGLRPAEIAARSGLSRTHIYRLQQGDVRRPSFDTYNRLEKLTRSIAQDALRKGGL